ncbi:unannotated protein [freshwater metagenome]|uniref:Unannotated protein n=1 Tax=freshwater metagenome TaxID=449393 RepID=A0A6J6XH44_9ZZZZ
MNLLRLSKICNTFNNFFRTHVKGKLFDNEPHLARGDFGNFYRCADSKRTFTCCICFAHAIETDDFTTSREIWRRHMFHQLIESRFWIINQEFCRSDDFAKIMRRHICRHTYCDSRTTVNEKVGKCCWKYEWFSELAVVVWAKVDCIFICLCNHRHRSRCKTCFGVTHGSRTGIE